MEAVSDSPTDVITRVTFSPSGSLLASSSWDETLRVYSVGPTGDARSLRKSDCSSPILDCIFLDDDSKVAFGDLNKNVNILDVESGTVITAGKHNAPVRSLRFHKSSKTLISGGWDKKLKAFDMRCNNNKPVADIEIYGKVYCMDIINNTLVVGDSMKRVYIYDLSKGLNGFATPDTKDGVLKFQYRCISCFPDERGFTLGSIEGRVAWEYFSKSPEIVSQQYAFKCHRNKTTSDSDIAYAVNSIDFHPIYGTFVTGGGDGIVCAWDGFCRKRLWKTTVFDTAIASLSFNHDGTKLAIATSDVLQLNSNQSNKPAIHIREIKPDECKPRNTK